MALGLTQPLTEISNRNISWRVKAAGAYGRQRYHLRVPIVLKCGSLKLQEPSGHIEACNGIALPLPLLILCNPSMVLGFKFQLVPKKGGFEFIVPLDAFKSVRCT
jgi:hypothetical protein